MKLEHPILGPFCSKHINKNAKAVRGVRYGRAKFPKSGKNRNGSNKKGRVMKWRMKHRNMFSETHPAAAVRTVKKPGHEWHEWREGPPWECDLDSATWAQRFALQQSGANLTGKRFRGRISMGSQGALSREIGARLLAGGRPCGGGKSADYQPALRKYHFVAAMPIRVIRGCF
jgi:hypothetical protein